MIKYKYVRNVCESKQKTNNKLLLAIKKRNNDVIPKFNEWSAKQDIK